MKIRTSLAVAACAAFGTYGVIFISEPPHSAVAVPVGAVFTAVLIACRVVHGGRRAHRARSRAAAEDARRDAASSSRSSGPYRLPPREWHDVCDARERLEWARDLRARGAAPAWHVGEAEIQLAEAQRAWRRTGWHR